MNPPSDALDGLVARATSVATNLYGSCPVESAWEVLRWLEVYVVHSLMLETRGAISPILKALHDDREPLPDPTPGLEYVVNLMFQQTSVWRLLLTPKRIASCAEWIVGQVWAELRESGVTDLS